MNKTIEFYFDFISPASYFASTQLPIIAKRNSATISYKPVLLGGIFKAVGNSPPASIPAKGAWLLTDLFRFAKRYQIEFNFNPNFPFKTLDMMRGAIWIQNSDRDLKSYVDAMFRAVWVEQKNLLLSSELETVLNQLSIDPLEFESAVSEQTIKDGLKANTEEAVARGAFGAPTMFIGKEMFFGQDRLDFLEEELQR